jgi:hypothetical protein
MTSTVPFEILEERAAQQRRQLHNSVNALRDALRDRLDLKKNAREYLLPASGGAALVGLVLGWGIGGIFARD